MSHAVTCIQLSSENYSVSSLDLSLKVTLTLSGQTQSEPFDVFVIAKDTLSADCMLHFVKLYYLSTICNLLLQQMILLLVGM